MILNIFPLLIAVSLSSLRKCQFISLTIYLFVFIVDIIIDVHLPPPHSFLHPVPTPPQALTTLLPVSIGNVYAHIRSLSNLFPYLPTPLPPKSIPFPCPWFYNKHQLILFIRFLFIWFLDSIVERYVFVFNWLFIFFIFIFSSSSSS